MKKYYQRWYEKDDYTRAFMSLLQDLPPEKQCEVALEIIIKASSMIDRDYEKLIKEVADYDPREYKRWYDKNPSVHVAVESLRDLDDEQKAQLFDELSDVLELNEVDELILNTEDIEIDESEMDEIL